jgi:hypothetical protein
LSLCGGKHYCHGVDFFIDVRPTPTVKKEQIFYSNSRFDIGNQDINRVMNQSSLLYILLVELFGDWASDEWMSGDVSKYLLINLFDDSVKKNTSTLRSNFDAFQLTN